MPKNNQKISPETFIQEMTDAVEPLNKKLCQLYWQLATTGEENAARELAETEKKLKLLFSNPDQFAQLKQWERKGMKDPLIAQQIEILIKSCTPNQLDEKTISDLVERQTEIENIFNNFRTELDGKKITNNDIKDILKKEKNEETRKKAWEASKQIAEEVSNKVLELTKRRNKAAQKLGFVNHFEMSLGLQDLNSKWLLNLFYKLKQDTEETFSKKIGDLHKKLANYYGTLPEKIRPWHYEDPFSQETPAQGAFNLDPTIQNQDIVKVCREFYQGIDLDIADVLERSDLFEKKGKSQHAFCISMDKRKDVRVLCNIRPNTYWASTMLHELGHAAYSKNIDADLPYFLRDEAHLLTTEAIAMLMERMLKHPEWLEQMMHVSKEEVQKITPALWNQLALDKLITARWVMVVTNFEKALYTNPDQDLNGLWWKLVKEFQLISKPEGRDYPDWAAKIHISTIPVYYQNYLLGELFAAQIADTLEKEALKKPLRDVSFCNNPHVGKLLKERLFKMGSKWRWDKLVPHVTHRKLDQQSFVRQFCS